MNPTDPHPLDISCPSCDYNLRGIAGNEVTCPECGARVDIIKILTGKPPMPWNQAPGFSLISLAGFLLCAGPVVDLGVGILRGVSSGLIVFALLPYVGAAGLMWLAARKTNWQWALIGSFALAAATACFFIGLILSITCGVGVVVAISMHESSRPALGQIALSICGLGIGVLLLWLVNWTQKKIGNRILRYARRKDAIISPPHAPH